MSNKLTVVEASNVESVELTKEQQKELENIVESLSELGSKSLEYKWLIGQKLNEARSIFGEDADKPYGLWIKENLSHIHEIFDVNKTEDANRKNRNRILTIGKLQSWKMINSKLGLGLSTCYKLKHDDLITLNGLWNDKKEEFKDLEAVAEVAEKYAPKAAGTGKKADSLSEQLDKANQDIEKLEGDLAKATAKAAKQTKEINKLKSENKAKDTEIQNLKAELEALKNGVTEKAA